MSKFSRRQVIGGGSALLIGAGLDGKAQAMPASHGRLRADVCVVGAGYSGLTAAWRLKQAGRSVIVLEARNRIGGRSLTSQMKGGGWIDLGGQWVGPDQNDYYALIKEVGGETYTSYDMGKSLQRSTVNPKEFLRIGDEITSTYPCSEQIEAAYKKVDDLAATIDPDRPWAQSDAEGLDAMTFAEWLR